MTISCTGFVAWLFAAALALPSPVLGHATGAQIGVIESVALLSARIRPGTDPNGVEIMAHWRVHGVITHGTHEHLRVHESRATFEMARVDASWKLTACESESVDRLFHETPEGTSQVPGS